MNLRIRLSIISLGMIFQFCTKTSDEAFKVVNEQAIRSHIEVLSSDEYEGRAPATLGEEKTVNYIINQFKEANLKPAFGTSFVQMVPVIAQKTDAKTAFILVKTKKNAKIKSNYTTGFMAWPSNQAEKIDLKNLEMVYVGYGIQAPEENWDDYKGLDVKGKVLIMKNNDPSELPNYFAEKKRLYYGRYDYKYEIAEKLGAAGVLIIHTTETAGYPWQVVSNSWGGERFELKSETHNHTQFNGWITQEYATELFATQKLDLKKVLASAEDVKFKPVVFKNATMDIKLEASYSSLSIKNVGAILEGSDSKLKYEFVVFTAHHDHLGIGTPIMGDSIYNGALDNASGIASMLQLAKAYSQIQPDLKRSLLFLAVAGEEKGLLGSKYYAENPTIEPKNISANINIDGINVYGKTKDAVYVGLGRSTIDSYLLKNAEKLGRTIKPDQKPEQGFYYRSDHFSFAKVGVPAMYLGEGVEFIDKPADYLDKVEALTRERYHTVFDEMDSTWDLSGAILDLKLIYGTALDIINAPTRMEWNKGDEFELIRLESK